MNNGQKITAEQIKELLGAPSLVRGESEEEYWNWWSTFVEAYKPDRLSVWLEVNDLAVKQWEQNRLRRCNSALIDGAMIKALKKLLRPHYVMNPDVDLGYRFETIEPVVAKVAEDYFAGNDEDKSGAREEVAAWGITDDHILAEATLLRSKDLVLFDRMDNYRVNARRILQKELDRRLGDRHSPPDQSESLQ